MKGRMLPVLLIAVAAFVAAPSSGAVTATPGQTPVENVLTLKIQPRIAFVNLARLGLLVRTRSDEPVTVRARILVFNRKTGFRVIASSNINTPATVHQFRLRPKRQVLGPNRSFCLFYRVAVTTAEGGGGSGSGCLKVIGRR